MVEGFLVGSDSKELACNAGGLGLIPGLGRSPAEGNGYPLQYSCLENSVDRGARSGRKESDMTERLSTEPRDSMQYYLATWTILRNTVRKQKARLQ